MPQTRWRAQPGLLRAYLISTTITAGIGVAMLLGGTNRMKAPAFATLRNTGGPYLWGTLVLAVAVVLIVAGFAHSAITLCWALTAGAVLYGVLGVGFLYAALRDPAASFWGVVQLLGISAWHMSQSYEYRASLDERLLTAYRRRGPSTGPPGTGAAT